MPVDYNKAPVSNRERQRQFRERHPHYYRDLHRRKKAQIQASLAAKAEAKAAAQAQATAPAALDAPVTLLALPAPEDVAKTTVTMNLPDAFTYAPAKITILTAPAPGSAPAAGEPVAHSDIYPCVAGA